METSGRATRAQRGVRGRETCAQRAVPAYANKRGGIIWVASFRVNASLLCSTKLIQLSYDRGSFNSTMCGVVEHTVCGTRRLAATKT